MSNAKTFGSRRCALDVASKKACISFLPVPAIRVLLRICSAVRGVSRVLTAAAGGGGVGGGESGGGGRGACFAAVAKTSCQQ